jgi:serine/threonine-protein kinase
MAPEQIRGDALDHRVDIFAMGVVLWESISGRRLFKAETSGETAGKVVYADPPSLSSVRRDVPAELDEAVRRALAKHPRERYQSARKFAEGLGRCGMATTAELAAWLRSNMASHLTKRQALARVASPFAADRQSLTPSGIKPRAEAAPPTRETGALSEALPSPQAGRFKWLAAGLILVGGGAVYGYEVWTSSVPVLQRGVQPFVANAPSAAAKPDAATSVEHPDPTPLPTAATSGSGGESIPRPARHPPKPPKSQPARVNSAIPPPSPVLPVDPEFI